MKMKVNVSVNVNANANVKVLDIQRDRSGWVSRRGFTLWHKHTRQLLASDYGRYSGVDRAPSHIAHARVRRLASGHQKSETSWTGMTQKLESGGGEQVMCEEQQATEGGRDIIRNTFDTCHQYL